LALGRQKGTLRTGRLFPPDCRWPPARIDHFLIDLRPETSTAGEDVAGNDPRQANARITHGGLVIWNFVKIRSTLAMYTPRENSSAKYDRTAASLEYRGTMQL
jgi:hypothetical protein